MRNAGSFGRFILAGWFLPLVLLLSKSEEILGTNSEEDELLVDQQEPSDVIRLPNSHSAALVMAFIFFCVLAYGAYRICKYKCGKRSQALTVSLSVRKSAETSAMEGLEDFIKEREAYLAIYGPKKNISTVSSAVSKSEPV